MATPTGSRGPLAEMIQLANVAAITGEPFTSDPTTGAILDRAQASALLPSRVPQRLKGWSI